MKVKRAVSGGGPIPAGSEMSVGIQGGSVKWGVAPIAFPSDLASTGVIAAPTIVAAAV